MNHIILGVLKDEGFVVVGANVCRKEGKGLQLVWGRRVDPANGTGSLDTLLKGSILDKKLGFGSRKGLQKAN